VVYFGALVDFGALVFLHDFLNCSGSNPFAILSHRHSFFPDLDNLDGTRDGLPDGFKEGLAEGMLEGVLEGLVDGLEELAEGRSDGAADRHTEATLFKVSHRVSMIQL
jgi:hypothetical protein